MLTNMLQKTNYPGPAGPVVLVIMDGVGIGKYAEGDAVRSAFTPCLDWLKEHALSSQLKAHGTAVGLPSDEDMGNSEVGHNAIGCGRVFAQGAKLVNDGDRQRGHVPRRGLAEAGGQLPAARLARCISSASSPTATCTAISTTSRPCCARRRRKASRGRAIHILLDGRDVGETSALDYVDPFEEFLTRIERARAWITASPPAAGACTSPWTATTPTGRWSSAAGIRTCSAKGAQFASAHEAIETYRRENPGVIDQDLPAFVIAEHGAAGGADRGWRLRHLLQFPRRPRHRDHPRLRGGRRCRSSTAAGARTCSTPA